jgi:c(7)-type cytochrome triheme protein
MRRLTGLSPRQRLLIGGAVAGLVVVIVVLLLVVSSATGANDEQPIAFRHDKHATNGIQCQFCHSGVYTSAVAGIPSVQKCMGCHAYIATDSNEIKKLAGYWARQEPIPWVRVNQQPSYVYFNHAPHIAAGVSCGSCHGEVAKMTVAKSVAKINMDFCLECHTQQKNKTALRDCTVCHR